MRAILFYTQKMAPFMLTTFALFLFVRFLFVKRLKRNGFKTNIKREITLLIFVSFSAGLASLTVLPLLNWDSVAGGGVNFVPFVIFRDSYRMAFKHGNFTYFLINFAGNIVMFMPIGFFPPLLWRKINFKKAVLIAFLCSLFIELCQLRLARGTDIDDLWLNTLGGILGYAAFLLMKKILPDLSIKNVGSSSVF